MFKKYIISRTDGTPIDPSDFYFVLKIKGQGDPTHLAACRAALKTYATEIKDHLPELSKELFNYIDNDI